MAQEGQKLRLTRRSCIGVLGALGVFGLMGGAPVRAQNKVVETISQGGFFMSDIEHFLATHNTLGEGSLWSVAEQTLYWVDIVNDCYWRLNPQTGAPEVVPVGSSIGVMAQRASGGLVMATRHNFAFWGADNALHPIGQPVTTDPTIRFNDGAVDCRGRFWAGTMNNAELPISMLYRLDPDGSIHTMETNVRVSNGIGWSPDNTVMYFTDSPLRIIYAYDFDAETGGIANRRTFVHLPDEPGVPDGLTVDSEGCVWSCYWDGAKIIRFTPSGQIERIIPMPVLRPTSCVFGGPNLDELYITSAFVDLTPEQKARYPFSGDLFRLKTGMRGLPKFTFKG